MRASRAFPSDRTQADRAPGRRRARGTAASRRSSSARRAGTAARPERRSQRCARRSAGRRARRRGRCTRAPREDIRAAPPRYRDGVSLQAVNAGRHARAEAAARAWRAPSRARVVRVRERLREVFGVPLMRPHRRPLAELVLTVLSQSTNDRNRDVAYLRLRERLPTWEAVRDAPVAEVEEAIRPGGISKVKSQRIQAILRAISADPRRPISDRSAHELSLD